MPGDSQGVSVPLSLFSGLVTELSVPDLPEGLSPDNQDVIFLPGSVQSRPGLHKVYATPLSGNVTVVYQKTYVQPNGQPITLILDSAGNLWKEDVVNAPGVLTSLGTVPAGRFAQSCSAFGREYIAISDGVNGYGVPMQFDGTFLDRVTQDGPGISPTVANSVPTSAAVSNTGTGASGTISTVTPSDPRVITYTVRTQNSWQTFTITIYQSLTIVTTAPFSLAAGEQVSISGVTPTSFNRNAVIVSVVVNSTTFKIAYNSVSTATGSGGTVTAQLPSLVRNNNIVTATTSTPHGFQPGWQVQVSGISNTNLVSIDRVIRDASGTVFVDNFSTPIGEPVGAVIAINGVTNPDTSFNGTFTIQGTPFPGQIVYPQAGTAEQSSAGTGNIQDVWNGTFYIQSVPSPTTFTYHQLGVNNFTNGTGVATVLGQVAPGNHNCVVMFLTRQGYLTAPSPPVSIQANGGQQLLVTGIPIGPSNVVARVLAFTGAGGGNYFTLLTAPQSGGLIVGPSLVVNDNTSSSAIVDFADNTLFGGTGIDIPGRNQFAQAVLAPVAGFFGYASRLFTWGEANKTQNLINMGLDGGYLPQNTQAQAGSGANGGSGTAWTSPSNITSTSSYADANLGASATSKNLLAETFGFSVTGTPQTANVTFQFYWTGSVGTSASSISVQILKAGVAFGSPQTITLLALNQASSSAPNAQQLNFPLAGLTAADINNSAFGFQITITTGTGASADVFVRAGYITITNVPAFPAGWSTATSTLVGGQLVSSTLVPGFAYQMTANLGALDSLISQPVYQDLNGIPILQPSTQYSFRFNASASGAFSGNLVIDLFSPTQGVIDQITVLANTLPASTDFRVFQFPSKTPTVIPTDTQLRVYLSGVNNAAVITIDELELIFTQKPYRDTLARGSYVNAPEQFDLITGDIGPASDSSILRCFFEMRNTMYMDTAQGRHSTTDNGTGEPGTWTVGEISESVGALSIRSSDTGQLGTGDSGEQFEITASRGGAYIFWGGEMIKISQEIQTVWDSINFAVKHTIWVKNDPITRRCYFGLPLNQATAPSVVLVMDYRELNEPYAIATTAPFRQSYSGRMIATEICRKWTIWKFQANSGEIISQPNGVTEMTFGAGNGVTPGTANGFGNIYYLDSTKLTDDDYGQIVPYWVSYFFVSNDQEQALGLDSHRKLATYFTAFLTGVGQTSITPLSDTLANAYPPLAQYPLVSSQNHDYEWNINVDGERIAVKVGSVPTSGSDNSFNLQKMCLTLKKHPWSPVRGAI